MYCCKKFNKKEGRNKYRQVLWLKRLSTASHMSKYVCYPTKILRVACHMNSKPWVQYKRRDLKTKNKQKKQQTNKTFLHQLLRTASGVATNMACSLIQQTAHKKSTRVPQQHVAHGGTHYISQLGGFYECSGPCLLAHSCTQNNPVV